MGTRPRVRMEEWGSGNGGMGMGPGLSGELLTEKFLFFFLHLQCTFRPTEVLQKTK